MGNITSGTDKTQSNSPTDKQLQSQEEFASPTRLTDTLSGMRPSDAKPDEPRSISQPFSENSAIRAENERSARSRINGDETPQEKASYLNKILRGEISAVEAYSQAIEKFGHESQQLDQIRREHQKNCDALELFVQRSALSPDHDSGVWGVIVKTVIGAATLVGNSASIRALIEGEEHGLRQYREALELNLTIQERASIEDRIIPCLERHIATLKAMESLH